MPQPFNRSSSLNSSPSPLPRAPTTTLLTFVPTPVYTTGRRELGTLTPDQIALLKQPLRSDESKYEVAEVEETLRGGQITFHGPGQLVIYPILDLKSIRARKWPKGLSVRCYANLLEEATIRTLSHFGIQGVRTENPGVWINENRKIAALGVHLRRNITSYGVGFNLKTDLRWFDRIVACGLEGKQTTSLLAEVLKAQQEKSVQEEVLKFLTPEKVSLLWANEFADGLWGGREGKNREEGVVESITEHELLHGTRS
jgi:lipoyl(octanoyl) transferase